MRKLLVAFSLILTLFGSSVIVNAAVQKVTVTFSSSLDNENEIIGEPQEKNLGDVLNLDATALSDQHDFAFWVINGFVRMDLGQTAQLRVQSTMSVQAVFYSEGKHAVLFVDSNGKLIELVYVADEEDVIAPDVSEYTKPGNMVVNEETTWLSSEGIDTLEAINSSRIYILQYTEAIGEVEVLLEGATVPSITAIIDEVITIEASNLETFSYWADEEGNVLSFNPVFRFTATHDMMIIAETEEKTAESFVKMTDLTGIRVGYESYMGRVELHGEDELVEFGFIMSTTEVGAITHESTGVIVSKSNAYNPATGEFLMSFPLVNFLSIRAYAIIDKGTELVYVYNQLPGSFASDLFISEYIEGGSNNKALEIFNGTGSTVDLTPYKVGLYSNGSESYGNNIELTGTLAHGETLVIVNDGATADFKVEGSIESTVTYFNGDDAVALLKNDVVIDVIGVIGVDPGSHWIVGTGSTADNTLVRKTSVSSPTSSWNTEEWDVYPKDTSSYLGSHTMDGASVTLTDSQSILLDAMNIGEFGPIKADGTITLPVAGANGTTISWASDAEHIIDPSTKAVIIPSGAPETVTLTATISKGGLSKSVTRNVLVGLTYEERVLADKEALVLEVNTISEAGSFILPIEGANGSLISWESNSALIVIDGNTAIVTLPESGSVDVTLTATIEYDSFSDTKLFEVTVSKVIESKIVIDSGTFTGRSALPTGWTHSGLGSDYSDSGSKLKFDTSNDTLNTPSFVLTKTAQVSVVMKGNSFSGGKMEFKDQNGNVIHTVDTLTNANDTYKFTISDLTVTSITLVYTKQTGNIGVGSLVIEYLS